MATQRAVLLVLTILAAASAKPINVRALSDAGAVRDSRVLARAPARAPR